MGVVIATIAVVIPEAVIITVGRGTTHTPVIHLILPL